MAADRSIPIPDDVSVWKVHVHADPIDGLELHLDGEGLGGTGLGEPLRDPEHGARLVDVADLPKLYAHWAEGLLSDAVIEKAALSDEFGDLDYGPSIKSAVREVLRAAGLEDRS